MTARVLIDYSRAGEALLLRQHLPRGLPRVLLHAGAGDGLTDSLSRGFADEGWRCILVEPDTSQFAELQANCAGMPELECFKATAAMLPPAPRNLGLVLLSRSFSSAAVIENLEQHEVLSRVVAVEDSNDTRSRVQMYDGLVSYNFQYAGLAGSYSIWQRAVESPSGFAEQPTVELPPLEAGLRGRAGFDPVPQQIDFSGITGRRFLMVSGWAVMSVQERVPPLVWVEVSDRTAGTVQYIQAHRFYRPQPKTGSPKLNMSGFRAIVLLAGRPPNSYTLRVVQGYQDGCYRSAGELTLESKLESYEVDAREGLARKFLSGSGIEIGALQRPLRLPANCRVRYVDRLPLDELQLHYSEVEEPLQAPDLLDDGEKLSRVAPGSQDFVIANHFFEHSENPIETLRNLLRIVRPGGVLYMGVPDRRYTFDYLRPNTPYESLKRTFEGRARADREALFREWVTLGERFSGNSAEQRLAHLLATNYSIHYNVWTLDYLLGFLLRARSDFDLHFRTVSIVSSDNETIVLLERTET